MAEYPINTLNKIVRGPKRANYDQDQVHKVLDAHYLCHVSYVHNGVAMSIPTAYGRKGGSLFLHGAIKNRMLLSLLEQDKVSLTVTHSDGLVLARSVFHHSFNYRSVVVFGSPRLIQDSQEKMEALEIVTENIIPGRWSEARVPNEKELKATLVMAIDITEASLKVRTGGPVDEEEDYDLDIWAGVLPLTTKGTEPITDELSRKELPIPNSVSTYSK